MSDHPLWGHTGTVDIDALAQLNPEELQHYDEMIANNREDMKSRYPRQEPAQKIDNNGSLLRNQVKTGHPQLEEGDPTLPSFGHSNDNNNSSSDITALLLMTNAKVNAFENRAILDSSMVKAARVVHDKLLPAVMDAIEVTGNCGKTQVMLKISALI